MLCFVSLSESSMTNSSEVETLAIQPHKLLILDARSYAAAVANRAKGGGCECPGRSSSTKIRSTRTACFSTPKFNITTSFLFSHLKNKIYCSLTPLPFPEYYPNCEVVFMGMANIHSIRKSFQSLRFLCTQMPDPAKWVFLFFLTWPLASVSFPAASLDSKLLKPKRSLLLFCRSNCRQQEITAVFWSRPYICAWFRKKKKDWPDTNQRFSFPSHLHAQTPRYNDV